MKREREDVLKRRRGCLIQDPTRYILIPGAGRDCVLSFEAWSLRSFLAWSFLGHKEPASLTRPLLQGITYLLMMGGACLSESPQPSKRVMKLSGLLLRIAPASSCDCGGVVEWSVTLVRATRHG